MIHEALREQTTVAHQQLEKIVITRLKNIRSDADYAAFLKVFYAYFLRLEETIKPFITAAILPDYAERRHADSIAADIKSCGGSLNDLIEVSVPVIDSTVKALAALYVMEGSVMGGSIIVKILANHGITTGTSFFEGYGPDTRSKWSFFVEKLSLHIPEEHYPEAINTATATFSKFADAFELAAKLS